MTNVQPSSRVAVVILNWNGKHHLETYLPSVLQWTPEHVDVWVADNGSEDGSVAWLQSTHRDRVRVVELPHNVGFAEGYNQALAHIEADWYVLLNSDVRIVEPWIDPVIDVMQAREWAVASPLLVQDVDPTRCEHAGAAGGWLDIDGYPFCIGRVFDSCELVEDRHTANREVFWASGACFFIRRDAWEMAGGFDGSLFAHMEEIDVCWRLKNLGLRVGCVGSVRVQHLGGGTLAVASPKKTFLNFRNNLIVMLKNRRGFWPVFMVRRMALDGLAAWKFLLGGEVRLFWAVGKAHAGLYGRLFETLKTRRRLREVAVSPKDPLVGWWPRSLVWHHFVRGAQTVWNLPDFFPGR